MWHVFKFSSIVGSSESRHGYIYGKNIIPILFLHLYVTKVNILVQFRDTVAGYF